MLAEADQFVNWLRRRNPTARTWRDYRADLSQLATVNRDRPPGDVTLRKADRCVAAHVARGLQPSTINRRLAALPAHIHRCGSCFGKWGQ